MIRAEHIVKSFDGRVVLDDISVEFETGKTNLIIGRSGSGKTVLLKTLVGLHEPDSGDVWYDDTNFTQLDFRQRRAIRKDIGMIFQGFNLIPNLTAEENVELPLIYRGVPKKEREELAVESLKVVGLEHRMDHKPSEMSGGQQQRVAIARAIAARPPVILADEPTGNLDSHSTKEIMEVLKELHRSGRTVILITHDDEIAAQVNRVIRIKDGKVEADFMNEQTGEEYHA